MTELPQLKQIIEAALLASSTPLSVPQMFTLFAENEQPSHEEVARALEELTRDSENRGIELKEVASGFRYQVRAEVNHWVSRLWTERQTRYSRAQLETLALIAYRQPITRGEIENIRGVAVSSNIIKTLEEREWIRTVGHRDVPGRPELFGTTKAFLDYFNLKSLDELPPLAEIRDLSDFDPQMGLAPIADGDAPHVDAGDADPGADVAADSEHEAGAGAAAPANNETTEGTVATDKRGDEGGIDETAAAESGHAVEPAETIDPIEAAAPEHASTESTIPIATQETESSAEPAESAREHPLAVDGETTTTTETDAAVAPAPSEPHP